MPPAFNCCSYQTWKGRAGEEATRVLVDVLDHAMKSGLVFAESTVGESRGVLPRRNERAARRVGIGLRFAQESAERTWEYGKSS